MAHYRSNRRPLAALLIVTLLVVLSAVAFTWRPAIDPIDPPARSAFDDNLIRAGARLAAIGDCAGCHTTHDGSPYAGGVPLKTPFGTIYGTNITPDADTGIGTWSEEAFIRAMRQGIARNGTHLYPAFPYVHFTRATDQDLKAVYAFLMTRTPVRGQPPANELHFPFNIRRLVAGWNLLFLDNDRFQADSSRSEEWNRGAYLVQSFGHCSACHTPLNPLGAEKQRQYLSGGEAEGWYAPALNEQSPSPLPWEIGQLATYLRTGIADQHAIAGGPMQAVVYSLARASAEDTNAIAAYIASMMGGATPEREARARKSLDAASRRPPPYSAAAMAITATQPGERIYLDACASCHDEGRQLSSSGALQLPIAVAVHDPDSRSLIRIIREGIAPRENQRGRWMPAFAGMLTDEQITLLVQYLRMLAPDAPPWNDVASEVQKAKQ